MGRCRSCGLCYFTCPTISRENEDVSWLRFLGPVNGSWLGYSTNKLIRWKAASGGVITSLLIMALKEKVIDGAVVVKMKTGVNPVPKAVIATTPSEIIEASTSKYCIVLLSANVQRSICLHLGLFCGGLPTYNGTLYLLTRLGVYGKAITDLTYRGGGWPGRLLIKTSDGVVIKSRYPQYWDNSFLYFVPKCCLTCMDVFNRDADVAVGDAWLPRIIETDSLGTSLIIARTERGKELVELARDKGYIHVEPISISEVMLSQLHKVLIAKEFRGEHHTAYTAVEVARIRVGRAIARMRVWPLLNIYNQFTTQLLKLARYMRKLIS